MFRHYYCNRLIILRIYEKEKFILISKFILLRQTYFIFNNHIPWKEMEWEQIKSPASFLLTFHSWLLPFPSDFPWTILHPNKCRYKKELWATNPMVYYVPKTRGKDHLIRFLASHKKCIKTKNLITKNVDRSFRDLDKFTILLQ